MAHSAQARRVAIMQPYIFPYLGYFHLIEASDTFVFYDDVAHINHGWINRNRILLNGQPHRFVVPLRGASPNRIISDIEIHDLARFRRKFLTTLDTAYRKAPCFDQGRAYVTRVLDQAPQGIAALAIASVKALYEMLGETRSLAIASRDFAQTRTLGRVARLAAITGALGADCYVNAPGGRTLYAQEDFTPHGLRLQFVQSALAPYPQIGPQGFVPGLSIIDVVMHNTPDQIRAHLGQFTLG